MELGSFLLDFAIKYQIRPEKKGQESFAIPVTDLTDDVIASYLVLDNM